MLGIALPPTIQTGGGGVAETIAAIATSVVLLVVAAIWIWLMARRSDTGAAVQLPTSTTRAKAA
jgi:hypothetical protein